MKKLLIIFAVSAFFFSSCSSGETDKNKKSSEEMTKEELMKLIKNTEKKIYDVPPEKINPSQAKFLAGYYIKYAAYDDSLAPEYLYKAAGIYMNTGNPRKALKALDKVINNYPSFNKMENCFFLRGFVYDDKLKDSTNARKYYEEYLKKYPKGDFADDAKLLIENLGKSTEEMFQEIEKK